MRGKWRRHGAGERGLFLSAPSCSPWMRNRTPLCAGRHAAAGSRGRRGKAKDGIEQAGGRRIWYQCTLGRSTRVRW